MFQLNIYGYNSIDDINKDIQFNKLELEKNNILDKFVELVDELKKCYLPCNQYTLFRHLHSEVAYLLHHPSYVKKSE